MPRFAWSMGIALAGVFAGVAPALAQAAPPDQKDIWKGTGEVIVDGAAATHPRTAEAKPAGNYRLRKQKYNFRIEGQDGRRFLGAIQSGQANIPMLESLSSDGKWIYIASRDGHGDRRRYDRVVLPERHARRDGGRLRGSAASEVATRRSWCQV